MCVRRCMRMENLPSSPNKYPTESKEDFIFQMSRRDFSNGAILVFWSTWLHITHVISIKFIFCIESVQFWTWLYKVIWGHLMSFEVIAWPFKVIFRMFATKHRIWQSYRGHYLKSLQRLEVKGQMTSRENSRRFKSDLIPYLEIKRLPPSFDISITSQNQNENQKGNRNSIILIWDPYTNMPEIAETVLRIPK